MIESSHTPFLDSIGTNQISQTLSDLKTLALAPGQRCRIILRKEGERFVISKIIENPPKNALVDLFFRIVRFFQKPRDLDDLKEARSFFNTLRNHIQVIQNPGEKEAIAKQVEGAFDGLRALYEMYRKDTTRRGMIYRDDILDLFAMAQEPKDGFNALLSLKIQRVCANQLEPFGKKIKGHHIPLFRFEDLDTVQQLMKEKYEGRKKPPTLEEIRQDEDLRQYLFLEDASMGKCMEWMYEHGKIGKILNNGLISLVVTKYLGWKYGKYLPEGIQRTGSVLRFFQNMHISPSMEYKGEMYSYREMHGRSIRDERSLDEAFRRPVSPFARQILLQSASRMQQEVEKELENKAPVLTSTAFCRMRVKELGVGCVKKAIPITGKVLNNRKSNAQAVREEKGYRGQFAFSIKNMLGNEINVDTSFRKKIFKKEQMGTAAEAEYLYRCCLTNFLNREELNLVVQRLGPSDIHEFISTGGGCVLSMAEACRVLKNRISKDTNERKQLDELIQRFEQESVEYQKKGVAEVRGTRKSVSTQATRYDSPLSQNDRKVMLVEYEDGSIGVFVFIGAVGVNNVSIPAGQGEHPQGEVIGAMGFGDDKTQKRRKWNKTRGGSDIHVKGKTEFNPLGAVLGSFGKRGSTVISIYLKKEFRLTDDLAAVSHGFHRTEYLGEKKLGVQEFEFQTPMGQVIALPTAYHAMQVIAKQLQFLGVGRDEAIRECKNQGLQIETIVQKLLQQALENTKDPFYRGTTSWNVFQELRSAWVNPQRASPQTKQLLQELRENFKNYVTRTIDVG